jgi:hypothetical protein
MDDTGKLVAVIGDEVSFVSSLVIFLTVLSLSQDTVTGFVLAGIGHRTIEGQNFLIVKSG